MEGKGREGDCARNGFIRARSKFSFEFINKYSPLLRLEPWSAMDPSMKQMAYQCATVLGLGMVLYIYLLGEF